MQDFNVYYFNKVHFFEVTDSACEEPVSFCLKKDFFINLYDRVNKFEFRKRGKSLKDQCLLTSITFNGLISCVSKEYTSVF